jgi:hydrogenase maturation protein HypF
MIRLNELLNAVIQSTRSNESVEMIGARFHKTISQIAVDICKRARTKTGLNEVALSGGVWQNQLLLDLVRDGLEKEKFTVYFHKQVGTNDGGLALGQAVVANFQTFHREEREGREEELLKA